jgi:hypothetical protein
MSVENHIEALKKKHAMIDDSVDKIQRTAAINADDVKALKKQKLLLKDEISRLEAQPS